MSALDRLIKILQEAGDPFAVDTAETIIDNSSAVIFVEKPKKEAKPDEKKK